MRRIARLTPMSVLAKLDARSALWHPVARWPYVGLKWGLITLGAWLIVMSAIGEIERGELGIGTGTVFAFTLALIKGVVIAWKARAQFQSGSESN